MDCLYYSLKLGGRCPPNAQVGGAAAPLPPCPPAPPAIQILISVMTGDHGGYLNDSTSGSRGVLLLFSKFGRTPPFAKKTIENGCGWE